MQPYLDDSDLPPLEQVQPTSSAPPAAAAVPDEKAISKARDSVPVVRYSFDEGKGAVADSAASGPKASIHGAKHVKAGNGYAMSFDGNDDYVRVTDSKSLNITGADLTVECWFKIDDPKATWRGLLGNYHSGAGGYMLAYTGGGIVFYNGAIPDGPGCSINTGDGRWHHAVGVVDSGTMSLYMDGVKQESRVFSGQQIKPSTYYFEIGRYNFGKAFSGQIDDVAVYETAMTYAEIVKRYRKGRR